MDPRKKDRVYMTIKITIPLQAYLQSGCAVASNIATCSLCPGSIRLLGDFNLGGYMKTIIIRSLTATKRINKQIRKEIAVGTRTMRRALFTQGRSESVIEFEEKLSIWKRVCFAAFIVGVVLFGSCRVVPAAEIPKEKAILAIIGEAENQGFKGMLAVACAIRNKGNLHGVYGSISKRVVKHKYSDTTYSLAVMAWDESARRDITHGANHWENIGAFGCPSWVKRCVETFRYKDHVFYKEII